MFYQSGSGAERNGAEPEEEPLVEGEAAGADEAEEGGKKKKKSKKADKKDLDDED